MGGLRILKLNALLPWNWLFSIIYSKVHLVLTIIKIIYSKLKVRSYCFFFFQMNLNIDIMLRVRMLANKNEWKFSGGHCYLKDHCNSRPFDPKMEATLDILNSPRKFRASGLQGSYHQWYHLPASSKEGFWGRHSQTAKPTSAICRYPCAWPGPSAD